MAKYETQLQAVKSQLSQDGAIIVALPAVTSVDKLASGLSLYLALKQAGKDVKIITEDTLKVSHTNLFGVGDIKNTFPLSGGNNYVISLEGVVDQNGLVPSLERLDWYPEGQNLNLVFHVVPGQKFEPSKVNSGFKGAGQILIFTIGAQNLQELGNIYHQNAQSFSSSQIINIDNGLNNLNYGSTNIIDTQAASLSEMIVQVISGLGMQMDPDIATNIITGIYDATAQMKQNATPDSFMAVGFALQMGGRIPVQDAAGAVQSQPVQPFSAQPQPQQPFQQQSPLAAIQSTDNQGFDLSKIFNVNLPNPSNPQPQQQPQPQLQPTSVSQEEAPKTEYATSSSPEVDNPSPDWLVPKVFKGSGGGLG